MNRLVFRVLVCFMALASSPARAEFDPGQQLQQPEMNAFESFADEQEPAEAAPAQAEQQQPEPRQSEPEPKQQTAAAAPPPRRELFSEHERNIMQDPQILLSLDAEQRKKALEDGAFNFRDPEAYIDVEDAMHSKQFVHRHLLSKTIAESEPLKLGRYFINVLTTTSYVHQQGDNVTAKWIEYVAGGLQVSAGYATESRHSLEIGANLSSISYVYAGYRYFFGNDAWDVWPYAGVGYGIGMKMLNIADGPFEIQAYKGPNSVLSAVGGMLLPLPDVGVKLEVRADMWGSVRAVFTPAIGLIFYL